MKKLACLALAAVMTLAMMTGCGGSGSGGGNSGGSFGDTLRVASATDMSTFDPTAFTDLQTQLGTTAIYSRLVKFDKDLNIVNDVADSYENTSDLEWKFTLKQGVKFHDGTELKAQDVKASLERAKGQSLIAHIVEQIDTVECPDDYTVVIKTKVPYAPLLNNLADPCCSILPKALIDSGNDFNKNPIGSGPYTFTEWKPGEKAVFTKFADYFNQDEASQFEKLELRVVPEGSSRTIALETGDVDIVSSLDSIDYNRVSESDSLEIYETPANQVYYLVGNEDVAPFNNKAFRQALEYAVDKESVVQAAQEGRGDILQSVLPKKVAGYVDYGYTYDPEKAKELLKESGYTQPAGETIVLNTMSELNTKMAQVIQANLADIGINVEIEQNVVAYHMENCGLGNYTLAIGGWSTAPDPDRFLRPMFHKDSVGTNNFAQYKNDDISKMIDDAVAMMDEGERAAAYEEINTKLMDDAVIVPLTGRMITLGYQKGLKNVYMDPIFGMEFNTIRY